jgi:hypothetical protein
MGSEKLVSGSHMDAAVEGTVQTLVVAVEAFASEDKDYIAYYEAVAVVVANLELAGYRSTSGMVLAGKVGIAAVAAIPVVAVAVLSAFVAYWAANLAWVDYCLGILRWTDTQIGSLQVGSLQWGLQLRVSLSIVHQRSSWWILRQR